MKTDSKLRLSGKLLLAGIAILASSCRSDTPPKIEVCIVTPVGGADCVLADGTRKLRLPSEMGNYWATNQADMKAFSSWCYGTSPDVAESVMSAMEENAHGR